MRKFLVKVIAFSLLFLAVDKASYFILLRFKDKVHDKRMELVLKGEMNKDILVVGSSRGAKGIIAQQIEDSTGFSAYNLCYQASDISFHEFIIRTTLKFNATPKVILLTMDDPQELSDHDNYHFPSYDLYPHLYNHHINEKLIDLGEHGVVTRFLWTARIKKFHIHPEYEGTDPFDTVRVDGTQSIRHYAKRDFDRYFYPYNVSEELEWKKSLLVDIEQHCQQHGIQLVFVYPPNYKIHNPEFVTRMQHLADPKTLHCVYNYQDSVYLNKDLFYDADHMHISGARIFTNEVITFLDGMEALQR